MKKVVTFLALLTLSISTYSQTDSVTVTKSGKSKFIVFADKSKKSQISESQSLISKHFNLSKSDVLKLKSSNIDDTKILHERYSRYYNGIKVQNSEIIIHSKGGTIISINGDALPIFNLSITPSLESNQAIEIGLKYVNAKKYAWQSPELEAFIKEERGESNASNYPSPELVIWDRADDDKYFLAYKFEVFSLEPYNKVLIYIDAHDGSLLQMVDQLISANAIGSAVTRYSNTQNIGTESFTGGFRLRDLTRGQGVETWDLNKSIYVSTSVDFVDNNNTWNEWHNSNMDDAALDAHFAAEKTYDYFKNVHGRNSYNGANSKVKVYVHFGNSLNNALWDVSYNSIFCGDGDGENYTPLTGLDAIAHEFGHGVTYSYTNLAYTGESGAISEGLSDIWSARVEEYANVQGNQIWIGGEDFITTPDHRRNFSNPNASHYHEGGIAPATVYPDTYHGNGWYSGSWDYNGVHENNTVLSYWFYLLSNGGVGNNDLSHHYVISPIGTNKAANIVYKLYNYITPNMDFSMASMYTINIASTTYGTNSNEAIQTWNSWYAVGIGNEASNIITGSASVCPSTNYSYSLPSGFEGESITWSTSNNLQIVSGQGTRTVTIARGPNYPDGDGFISASYNHGNGVIISSKYLLVGLPGTLTVSPSGQAPIPMNLYSYLNTSIVSSPGADPSTAIWSANGSVIVMDNNGPTGAFYANNSGNATFYVTTSNSCGLSPLYSRQIIVSSMMGATTQDSTGSNEGLTSVDILIWSISPNPSNSYVDISLEDNEYSNFTESYYLELVDSNSRIIKSLKLTGLRNRIDIQDLSVGYYVVKLKYGNKTVGKILMVQK